MYKIEVIYRNIVKACESIVAESGGSITMEEDSRRNLVILSATLEDGSPRTIALAAYKYYSEKLGMRGQDAVIMQATNAPHKRIIPFDHPGACVRALPQIVRGYLDAQSV